MDVTIDEKSGRLDIDEHDIEQNGLPKHEEKTVAQVEQRTPMLERFINLPSAITFEICMQSSWEVVATTFQFALLNGGPASMVYGGILAGFGSTMLALSLAELASMDPNVGAQYRWSAKFAPAAPRFWGLMQGWLTVSAWLFAAASNPANLANIVTALTIFNREDYVYHRWHTAMLMWLFTIVPFVFNLWIKKVVNTMETTGVIVHVVFFIVSITTLAALAQRSTDGFVFNNIVHDISGWTNPGVAFGIGLLTVMSPLVGSDGVLHMSAEVKRVRTRAPYSIISSVISNAIMQWAFIICLLYSIGNIDAVTNTPTGLPIIEVFYQATNSKAVTNVFVVAIAIVIFVSLFNVFASTSRLTWAFARDHGLPFSHVFSKIHPKFRMPLNSIFLTCAVCFILSLIYIGSSTAFNAIISLNTFALYISYIPPILFFFLRKVRGPPVEYGPFKLGRWGIPVNLMALAYLTYTSIWIPFPTTLPVTAQNMNYTGPITILVIIGAFIDWSISGHKRFEVPVAQNLEGL